MQMSEPNAYSALPTPTTLAAMINIVLTYVSLIARKGRRRGRSRYPVPVLGDKHPLQEGIRTKEYGLTATSAYYRCYRGLFTR
jgi:hypothetical protein